VKRVNTKEEEEMGMQSFAITGDLGVILNCCVVPGTSSDWTHDALNETCNRFPKDKGAKILHVNCGCCNGKLGGRARSAPKPEEEGYQLWKTVLEKKQDGLHVTF